MGRVGSKRMASAIGVDVGVAGAVNDQEREMAEGMAAAHRTAGEEVMEIEHDDVEKMIRRELINAMTGSWENVVEIYKPDPRSHTVKIGGSWNTALHLAILSRREDTAQKLVDQLIFNYAETETEKGTLEVLSTPNRAGNAPLHLAAMFGSIKLCKSIIGGVGDRYKQQLLAARNPALQLLFWWLSPLVTKTHSFGSMKCVAPTPKPLTAAAQRMVPLLFTLPLKMNPGEGLADIIDNSGYTPLYLLGRKPTAFRSGIYLGFFKNIIYHCLHVEELVPVTFKEKKELLPPSTYPSNYQTCVRFCHLLWKMIKSASGAMLNGKSGPTSNKPLDIENPEERQGIDEPQAHNSEKEAQGRQGFPSRSYGNFFKFIMFSVSKMLMFIFWTILGSSEVRKLKEAKEKHIWSLQIMNILIKCAKKCTYGMNSQNYATGERKNRYSEYEYFARGPALTTPILLAAANGVKEIVDKILQEFPMTILDRDYRGKNIAMLAAEHRQSHVYDFLLRNSHIAHKDLIFIALDGSGDTALHLTARLKISQGWIIPTGMLQMQWEVKWYEYVKESLRPSPNHAKNFGGKFPNQIFMEEHEALLDKSKEWVKNTCNSCSFIAALIATVVFTSSATVPGGLKQDNGKPIFQHHLAFQLFSISSLVALCTSFISLLIFLTLLTTNYQYKDFNKMLPQSLIFALTSLFTSMAAMLVCFCSGHFLMLENQFKYAVIPVYAFTCLAISYFAHQKFPSYVLLLKATFNKVPERIYKEDPL